MFLISHCFAVFEYLNNAQNSFQQMLKFTKKTCQVTGIRLISIRTRNFFTLREILNYKFVSF